MRIGATSLTGLNACFHFHLIFSFWFRLAIGIDSDPITGLNVTLHFHHVSFVSIW